MNIPHLACRWVQFESAVSVDGAPASPSHATPEDLKKEELPGSSSPMPNMVSEGLRVEPNQNSSRIPGMNTTPAVPTTG